MIYRKIPHCKLSVIRVTVTIVGTPSRLMILEVDTKSSRGEASSMIVDRERLEIEDSEGVSGNNDEWIMVRMVVKRNGSRQGVCCSLLTYEKVHTMSVIWFHVEEIFGKRSEKLARKFIDRECEYRPLDFVERSDHLQPYSTLGNVVVLVDKRRHLPLIGTTACGHWHHWCNRPSKLPKRKAMVL